MLDEGRCRLAIREAFPALDVQSARYFAAGWDYELWEINGELLFRFPLREECASALRVEARLLPELAQHVSLAIPRPQYYSDGVEAFRLPFFAYRKLPGVALTDAGLTDDALSNIGRQVGRFLRELHSFPTDRAEMLGVPVYSAQRWRTFYIDFRAQCDVRVNPLLPANECERVIEFWSNFLENDRNFRFAPTLVHADLGPDHILVDPKRGELSGVIDFGDARVGDPAIDIVGLLGIQDAVVEGYGDLADETFLQRARVYWQIGPFHEVLYGLDVDKREHIDAGLAGIRSRVTEVT
jgi:aminoglycoside 2''-phosphotransferase